jgi:hypothetical protein
MLAHYCGSTFIMGTSFDGSVGNIPIDIVTGNLRLRSYSKYALDLLLSTYLQPIFHAVFAS